MLHEIFNLFFSLFAICFSIHLVYYTYKEPSRWFSTNMKGYTSGGIILIISIMSIAGKFSLLDTFINLTRKIFHLKAHQSGIGIAFIVALIFLVFGLTYYRPDKILAKHQKISEENEAANIKLLSGCFLFYYAFTLTFAYLIVWLVRK